jgi:prevent-host-death family protein
MIMVMKTREIPAGRFKAECLALLDEVAHTGADLIVTKRGKPVARVTPVEAPPSLRGSVRFNISDDELIAPLDEPWDSDAA